MFVPEMEYVITDISGKKPISLAEHEVCGHCRAIKGGVFESGNQESPVENGSGVETVAGVGVGSVHGVLVADNGVQV